MNLNDRFQTREDSTRRLQTNAHAVARALSQEDRRRWTENLKYPHFVEFTSDAGESLYISTQGEPGRFILSGSIELADLLGEKIDLPHKVTLPRITASASREPLALAREFCRRVLPGYREVMVQMKERLSQRNAYLDSVGVTGARLAEVVGGVFDAERAEVNLYRSMSLPEMCGDVKVYQDSVSLKLSVSPSEAEAMLRALVEVRKTRPVLVRPSIEELLES